MTHFNDLTQLEIIGLQQKFNLSDGHCHQGQSINQDKIIQKLPQLRKETETMKQHQLDQLFIDTFFTHQNQRHALTTPSLLTYASSISIVITANYLMKKNMSATLMTPCFDNLPDIFKSFNIPLEAIDERQFHKTKNIYDNLVQGCKTDALFIIDINNPTGFSLIKQGKKARQEIIRFCKDYNKLLVIDFCFAPLLNADPDCEVFDVYKLLIESGVTYIAYEDTGKIRPVQDAKVSILKSSMDIYQDIYNIKTAYLLNVSPFILRFLIEYVQEAEATNYETVRNMIETNRHLVETYTQNSLLTLEPIDSYITLARLKINDPAIKATSLQAYLADEGVHVLPGTYFYRNNHSLGEGHIRIALARDSKLFEQSMKQLQLLLQKFS